MIDHLSLIRHEPPVSGDTARSAKQSTLPSAVSGLNDNPVNRSDDIKKVAKDMESLFAYQLLKTMRETSQSLSGESPGYGNDTYMSLFDMEVSKIMADRGLGLQDAILKWLDRTQENRIDENNKTK